MKISQAQDARNWLAAWNNSPRRGILAEVIRGLEMASSIENGAPQRYSIDTRLDTREAIGVLRLAYFKLFGVAYVGK